MHEEGIALMESWTEIESLSEEVITLDTEAIDQAIQSSRSIQNPEQQWQTYLNTVALLSVEHWFNQRARDVLLNREQCSILQPLYASVIPAACNLVANGFKLCLIAVESQPDEEIAIPRAAIELPEFAAHFYVIVAIYEEQAQARIQGFLRYDQIVAQTATLQPEADWSYAIPLSEFEFEVDRLLLYLRCADPATMPLPLPESRQAQLARMQSELLSRLPQLQTGDRSWWQLLTWEQATVLLSSPELMNWVMAPPSANTDHLSDLLHLLSQPVINVSRWLQDQLDDLAQQLSWMLLPPLTTGSALRSGFTLSTDATTEFEAIVTQLKRNGMQLAATTRAAYRNLVIGTVSARLYVVTGAMNEFDNAELSNHSSMESSQDLEWSLLVILGPQPNGHLPAGIRLRISDSTGVLVQRSLSQPTEANYLFAQIIGTLAETFLVTITAPDGASLTLPPFGFQPLR